MVKLIFEIITKKILVALPTRKGWEQTKNFKYDYVIVNVVFGGKIFKIEPS